MLLHRPDQADAPLDSRRRRASRLGAGPARRHGPTAVDQQSRARVGELIECVGKVDGRLRSRRAIVRSRVSAPVAGCVWIPWPSTTTKLSALQRLEPDVIDTRRIAPSTLAVSSCSNAAKSTFCSSMVSASSRLRKVVIGGSSP